MGEETICLNFFEANYILGMLKMTKFMLNCNPFGAKNMRRQIPVCATSLNGHNWSF